MDSTLIRFPSWLSRLSTRRPAVEQPAAADVPDVPDVGADVAAIAREVRPWLGGPDSSPAELPLVPGSAIVPPMPDWRPGHPFGMARYDR